MLCWWEGWVSLVEDDPQCSRGCGQVDTGWLLDNITRQVGDVESTLFWTDPWLDGKSLCKDYARLYELSESKFVTVANVFGGGWGFNGDVWRSASTFVCLGGGSFEGVCR